MKFGDGCLSQIEAAVNIHGLENPALSPAPAGRVGHADVGQPFAQAYQFRVLVCFHFDLAIRKLS